MKPSAEGYALSLPSVLGGPLRLEYELSCPRVTRTLSRAVFEITMEGRPTVMLVPVTLLNGGLSTVQDAPQETVAGLRT